MKITFSSKIACIITSEGEERERERTWNVCAVGRNLAVNVPQTNAAEVTPASTPNADARFPCGILSAWR